MGNLERQDSPEAPSGNYWAGLFGRLSDVAKHKISNYGRHYGLKQIQTKPFKFNDIYLSVASKDVDKYLSVTLAVSRDNSDEDDIRPAKGINMGWATGEDEGYLEVRFLLWPSGASAEGQTLLGEDKELKLINSIQSASDFYSLAYIAIDNSQLPHRL